MAKFYVECGDIREIVDSPSKSQACFAALQRHIKKSRGVESYMSTEFTVSETGFVGDREGFVFTFGRDDIVNSQEIVDMLYE